MRTYLLLFVVLISLSITVQSQQVTINDYNRAVQLMWPNLVNKKVFNVNTIPYWFTDSSGMAWVIQDPQAKTFYKLQWNQTPEPLFNHQQMAKLLYDSLKIKASPNDLPINLVSIQNANNAIIAIANKNYHINFSNYSLVRPASSSRNPIELISPDGKWIAFVNNYNLFVKSAVSGETKQLTNNGKKGLEYALPYGWSDIIEGENGDRPQRLQLRWSPDSKWFQTYLVDLTKAQKMYLLDWSVDTLFKPKLLSYYRASPGDTDLVYYTPVFVEIETGKIIQRDLAKNTHTFPTNYEWSKQPGMIYEMNRKRGFQEQQINLINLKNNSERRLYTETSKTNIDNFNIDILEDWGQAIITSEKDGWKQLYLLNLATASIKPLTNGQYYVNSIFIQQASRIIFFLASGKEVGRNPYHQNLYRIGLDGKAPVLLTSDDANHDIWLSPNGKYFLDNSSTHQQPSTTVLRSSLDGKLLQAISKANVDALLQMGYTYPEEFVTKGRDGITPIYAVIHKPSNFDPAKKYPVIDQTYTGPHTNMFPRNFSSSLSRSNQALAELGFVVVTIDGMGTAGRSKSFQAVSYKNMGQNLLDHRIAINAMAQKYAWMDITRVGIFGHSAGGYDAGHAVLAYPDFYKVAVASSADHDFRMEKDWWPEMYMGWPVDSSYHFASNITMASNLKGKLLITHGGIDENVNPSATFKLAEALIKADKEFDMLILPSQRHGYTGIYNDYFTKKKWNYFVEHLLHQQPIWDFKWR
ncbi:MAG TPA: prolyl oligopeptidase family serine peptidase [Sediminibacterium sp.]|uniref:S9 family peptidase n=1 Tax=Sediminibacterium sp. TaxID=1917865 RepID=UPI000BCFC3D7|nr:prolyl oligopeptidase family serine peptidase [Sediminibacterium sp.]MBT9484390.1 prolyl oligopeptidase family serine peptidase [Sediminibacterium sp.]OZA62133.1 MAG: S9 family peptidase [Sphingobacteriia bacterium 39-39-8]HQS25130.1 prolyl oligopeptidase family serine peptidase [Sediminibacterium sp.]HQS36427.1 prolyl oligopeptidase family serine peptidase [Sediminibacterium sp.]